MAVCGVAHEDLGEPRRHLREWSAVGTHNASRRLDRVASSNPFCCVCDDLCFLVCAFHLHFDDEALHPNIAQWRTHRLPVRQTVAQCRQRDDRDFPTGHFSCRCGCVFVVCSVVQDEASQRSFDRAGFLAHAQRIHRSKKCDEEAQHLKQRPTAVLLRFAPRFAFRSKFRKHTFREIASLNFHFASSSYMYSCTRRHVRARIRMRI